MSLCPARRRIGWRLLAGALLATSYFAAGCADASDSADRLWTVEQAESITSIRGTPVRVRQCRGRGPRAERYRSFSCLASTRAAGDRYDTVGIFYVLEPLGKYRGLRSSHRLKNVRFIGGPGVP